MHATVLKDDEGKVGALDQREAEKRQARDGEREAELAVVLRREGEYAGMADEEYEQLVAALKQQHAVQRQREVEEAARRKSQLLQQLEDDCQRRLLHWEADQKRLMSDEEKGREDELVKMWANRLQGKPSDPRLPAAVAALMQKRQRRELEDLMRRLAEEKTLAVKQQLAERLARGDKDVSMAAIQEEVRQQTSQPDLDRLAELEDAHLAQQRAALDACTTATTSTSTPQPAALHYDAVELRRRAIAADLRSQQNDRASTVTEERRAYIGGWWAE